MHPCLKYNRTKAISRSKASSQDILMRQPSQAPIKKKNKQKTGENHLSQSVLQWFKMYDHSFPSGYYLDSLPNDTINHANTHTGEDSTQLTREAEHRSTIILSHRVFVPSVRVFARLSEV